MKKYTKSYLAAFTILIAVYMTGCDIFENFQFGLPISFVVSTSGNDNSPSGSESYCLEQNETYQDYAEDINSITFVEAHVVVVSISPGDEDAIGSGTLRLFEGTAPTGNPLFTHTESNIRPADYMTPNSYIVSLTQAQLDAVNEALKNSTCFYADYVFNVTSGGSAPYAIEFKVDALYNVDAKL